jgi:hypothetical protein
MNILWPRFLRSAFRREPISSFLLIVGGVDLAIGGFSGSGGLAFLGLMMTGGALGLRWWQMQRVQKSMQPEQVAQLSLPPQSSQSQMPMLSIRKQQPPQQANFD